MQEPSEVLQADQPGAPTTPKGRRTRARLLDAGRSVLEEKGYVDATVVEITQRAGVSLGGFYHYFANKDQLFLVLLEEVMERLYGATTGSWQEGDTQASLVESTRRYLQTYYADRRLIAALLQMSAVVPECADGWWKLRERVHARLQRRLETGEPRLDGSAALYISALASMVEQFAIHWYVSGSRLDQEPPSIDEAAEVLGTIWYRAVYAPPDFRT